MPQGSQGSKAVSEWSDLAVAPSGDYVVEEDPLFQDDINRLCNVGLKAMLKDDRRNVSEWQDELNTYGSHFGEEGNRCLSCAWPPVAACLRVTACVAL